MENLLFFMALASPVIMILGIAIKFYRISKMPLNLRWEIYPVPHETEQKRKYGGSYMEEFDWQDKKPEKHFIGEIIEPLKEIFYLHRVKKFNPYGIWIWSLALHWGIWLLFLWMGILLINGVFNWEITSKLDFIAYFSYTLGIIGSFGLIIKRFFTHDLKIYTSGIDYFNLLFLLFLFTSGLLTIMKDNGSDQFLAYVNGILNGSIPVEELSTITIVHFVIFELFLIYIPFSRFFHGPVKYSTFHNILWNDMYQIKGSTEEKKISEQLNYKVGWAGPHILSQQTWLENAKNTNLHEKI
ncbi:respiratory nitrate reductase subunit gamma [Thermodesulfovibrio sp.]|uniref:respiratory nitrate reductase subunit gamma n=1 Tax=Thermodesulfovibrio sp. TaxID=2067987 RepID=UPI003D101BD6